MIDSAESAPDIQPCAKHGGALYYDRESKGIKAWCKHCKEIDEATKPLHVEIESLRSQLSAATASVAALREELRCPQTNYYFCSRATPLACGECRACRLWNDTASIIRYVAEKEGRQVSANDPKLTLYDHLPKS